MAKRSLFPLLSLVVAALALLAWRSRPAPPIRELKDGLIGVYGRVYRTDQGDLLVFGRTPGDSMLWRGESLRLVFRPNRLCDLYAEGQPAIVVYARSEETELLGVFRLDDGKRVWPR